MSLGSVARTATSRAQTARRLLVACALVVVVVAAAAAGGTFAARWATSPKDEPPYAYVQHILRGDDGAVAVRMAESSLKTTKDEDGSCGSFHSSQLHGAISQKRAADIVHRLVSRDADARSCPVFFQNYHHRHEGITKQEEHDDEEELGPVYASWTPWQPSDTLDRWSRHLPCQSAEFCDDLYPIDETKAIARLIHGHQHPLDCSRAKFLVIEREWHAGFGSTVHIKAYSLLVALMSGRVLIDSPDIQWTMTFAASCETQDWACYFAPLTNCSLPEDWRTRAKPFTSIQSQSNDQFVVSGAEMQLADAPGIGNVKLAADNIGAPSSSTLDSKPASWWMTQATGYVARPNERTLRTVCYIWDCIVGPQKQPPRPFAAMFIRRGDKWWESRLREPFEYFDLLEGLDRILTEPIKGVYVGTDDPQLLSQVAREYSSDWDLAWMGYHRSSQGSQHHEEVGRYHTAKMELQVLLTLAEVFISASADVLIGTLSSNQCRLMDELRKLQGKGRMPYLTPEGELIAGQR